MSGGGWRRLLRLWQRTPRAIPEPLWRATLADYGFLGSLAPDEQERLRALSAEFLGEKEFHGAGGLQVTDQMAVAIAAQACLPLLHLAARPDGGAPGRGSVLRWYRDFVGIVVQPGEVVARRDSIDETGVVHQYDEVLAGEAMDQGPVMLSWQAVAEAGYSADAGYNVVVHEFAHKLDMADGLSDGCPPLPVGFMGAPSQAQARRHWHGVWEEAYAQFCDAVVVAERFGGATPWLDSYASQSLDEFFAVACEAYFVNRPRFSAEFAALVPLLDAFFRPG
ncbi:zinc-dependent peptidase [Pseudorhodoferax sp.]|uniref:M90 family metallopeptidase n=1 Tax=Pseudorhodoferax sp. TaxID=1993553 RepID=UPI002DD6A629|nr:M90 family metallopeptidase [Pseudorhodoferax sp.]